MDKASFLQSLKNDEPPVNVSSFVIALWYDAKGQWEKAHEIVQEIPDAKAAKIHAYLHRKEGDLFNADYWYSRSGTARQNMSLEEEWNQLLDELI